MSYDKIKKHVHESLNLSAELAELIIYGRTQGSKTPDPFVLNEKQRWGLRHLIECRKCGNDIISFIDRLKSEQNRHNK